MPELAAIRYRMRFSLFLVFLFLSPEINAARLIFKLRTENRDLMKEENSSFRQSWKTLGLEYPLRCFPRHPAMPFKEEQAFGPTDLSLLYRVEIPEPLKTDFMLKAIRKMPAIAWAEWEKSEALPLGLPNDPAADSVSGSQRQVLKKIRAYQGWNLSEGDSSVVIGILDTGTPIGHEDLSGNLKRNWADPINGIDDDGNGLTDDFTGWDFGSNDNNPTPDNTGTSPGHGTSVSSLAAASTDNATGVAGIGWKCRILPVKIWNWNGSFSNFSGYEAIVYAADMGCKVINCSWGSPSSGSQFEQDIIRYATFNKGALVVAAGGNTPGYYQFMPANYDYAFGVSMTDSSDRISSAASRHFKLDIMAPGIGVYGIKTNGSYGWVEGGSSMASPMVAGAAGLLLAKFPELSGLQAGELLRVNSDTIYSLTGNAGYRDQTGRGRLNIERALNRENRISLRAVDCIPRGLARPGDTLRLAIRLENYLDSISGFSISLHSSSANLTMLQNSATFGSLGSMKEWNTGAVFTGLVNPSISGRKEISIRADVSCGNYRDSRWFTIQLNAGWLDLDSNQVKITVVENGRLGFADLAGYFGSGIRHRGIQLSSDAGLMLGTGPTRVSNCVFAGSGNDLHFKAENRLQYVPYPNLNQHAVFHFNDSLAGAQVIGLGVKQSAWECTSDSLKDCAFISYQITNRNTTAIDSLCLGLYNDWESGNPEKNFCRWVDSLQLGYTRPASSGKLAATLLLGSGEPQFFAIDAIPDTSGNNINLFDGFSQAEKWKTLSSGIRRPAAGALEGSNVLQVCGAKWRNLQAGETRKIGFAFLYADSLPELLKKAKAGRSFFRQQNTSPNPLPAVQDFCEGDTLQVNWTGAKKIAVFADSLGLNPVFAGSGSGFSPWISSDTAWYISGRDSLFPSALKKLQFIKKALPELQLSCDGCAENDSIPLGSSLLFAASGNPGSKTWYRNGEIIPGPSNVCCLTFTPEQSGPFSVCVEITDSLSGCHRKVCRELTVFQITQTEDPMQGFRLFPNPVLGELTLDLPAAAEFSLFEITGRRLLQSRMDAGRQRLNLSGIPRGMYLWKTEAAGRNWQGKLVKEQD